MKKLYQTIVKILNQGHISLHYGWFAKFIAMFELTYFLNLNMQTVVEADWSKLYHCLQPSAVRNLKTATAYFFFTSSYSRPQRVKKYFKKLHASHCKKHCHKKNLVIRFISLCPQRYEHNANSASSFYCSSIQKWLILLVEKQRWRPG